MKGVCHIVYFLVTCTSRIQFQVQYRNLPASSLSHLPLHLDGWPSPTLDVVDRAILSEVAHTMSLALFWFLQFFLHTAISVISLRADLQIYTSKLRCYQEARTRHFASIALSSQSVRTSLPSLGFNVHQYTLLPNQEVGTDTSTGSLKRVQTSSEPLFRTRHARLPHVASASPTVSRELYLNHLYHMLIR